VWGQLRQKIEVKCVVEVVNHIVRKDLGGLDSEASEHPIVVVVVWFMALEV
jgi:hypothetical protein